MKFYDTNILMDADDSFFKDDFAVSAQTVIELEEIKSAYDKDEETKYKARKGARRLLSPKCTVVLDWDGIRDILAEAELAEKSARLAELDTLLNMESRPEPEQDTPETEQDERGEEHRPSVLAGLKAAAVEKPTRDKSQKKEEPER